MYLLIVIGLITSGTTLVGIDIETVPFHSKVTCEKAAERIAIKTDEYHYDVYCVER